jgi:c-di-GMP-binding flagellar brake protein YcgR
MSMSTERLHTLVAGEFEKNLIDNSANTPLGSTSERSSFPFDAMKLKIGDRLQAQPPAKLSTERCTVRLIGYVQDASLLVTTPLVGAGVRLQFLEGEQLVIRIFSSQNAYGFASEVQRVCKLPYAYLHLSFPAQVQGTVIRKASRVKTKIIAEVATKMQPEGNIPAVISNISTNGLLLDAKRELAGKGDLLKLVFGLKLHGVDSPLSVTAKVCTVFIDEALVHGGGTLAHFGLEFVDLSPNDHMLLKSMVYQQMIEHPQELI